MDIMGFLASPKWELLKSVSASSQSPTRLAKQLHTSIPNVLHHLKLMEAYGLIDSSAQRSSGAGKPPKLYGLASPIIHLTFLDEITQEKKRLNPSLLDAYILRCLLESPAGWKTPLIKLGIQHPELITKETAVGIRNCKDNKCDIAFIGPEIGEYRQTKSKITIDYDNKKYEFAIWSHTPEEFRAGIQKKEEYFQNIHNAQRLHDPKSILNKNL